MKYDPSSSTLSFQRANRERKYVLPSLRVSGRVAKRFSPTWSVIGLLVMVEDAGGLEEGYFLPWKLRR